VFYHVCAIGNWREIFEEQIGKVKASGLLDVATQMVIGVVSPEDVDLPQMPKTKYIVTKVNEYERTTLLLLWRRAMEAGDEAILYFHTKGVTSGNACVTAWRRFMEYFNIVRWKECVRKLEEGYDACGVNWWEGYKRDGVAYPHFSGNFWWARSSYLKTLPEPPQVDRWLDRVAHEFWIGSRRPRAFSFCDNPKAFYTTKIEEKDYVRAGKE